MKTLSQTEVNVAIALASGTLTIQDCFNERLGVPYTAVSDEHGLIITFMANQEAQEFVNRVYEQFVTTAQTVGCYQHR